MATGILNNTFTAIDLCIIIGLAQCIPYNEETSRVNRLQIECLDESKVSASDILNIKNGDWVAKNIAVKKWALCILVRAGLMTPQGVYRLDEALVRIPDSKNKTEVLKNIDDCLYQSKHEPHEIAWKYLKCYNAEQPKDFQIL